MQPIKVKTKVYSVVFLKFDLKLSKLLNQKPHMNQVVNMFKWRYYQRIEHMQFTMNHDDGNLVNEVGKSDIILLGVSRTSKTPTSIYLANKGYKTSNIPLINENSIPKILKIIQNSCIVGLNTEAERLVDIRKNHMSSLKKTDNKKYTDITNIPKIDDAKKQKYGWPNIDVTRKSVEACIYYKF